LDGGTVLGGGGKEILIVLSSGEIIQLVSLEGEKGVARSRATIKRDREGKKLICKIDSRKRKGSLPDCMKGGRGEED